MASLGWEDIANDLLFLLAEKVVSVATFIRFSAVCKSWFSVASATNCCNPAPWLMLSEVEGSELRDFYDYSTGEIYQLHFPLAQGMRNVGSGHGWLITVSAKENDHFRLLNPLSGAQIVLPCTTAFPSMFFRDYLSTPEEIRERFIKNATCSLIEPSNDCIVAATHMGEEHLRLSYCRLTDKEWTTIELLATKCVAFVGGVLLILTITGEIYSADFTSSPPNVCEIVDLPIDDDYERQCYFVDCDDAIFVVEKRYVLKEGRVDERDMIYTEGFKVFRLNISKKLLNEVKSIGDYAFFIGMNDSICLPVSMRYRAFKKNSIYFVDDRNELISYRPMRYDHHIGFFSLAGQTRYADAICVFSLEDGSIKPSVRIPLCKMKSSLSLPAWIIVNFNNM